MTLMNPEKSFDMQGMVSQRRRDEITLARTGLPPAALKITKRTVVTFDGKAVDVRALPKGAEVQAKFQMVGDEPIALRVDAIPPGAMQKGIKSPAT